MQLWRKKESEPFELQRDIYAKIKIRDVIHLGLTKVRRMRGLGDKFEGLAIQRSEAPARLAEATSDLQRLFYGHKGRVVHKWVHYLPIYERYLGRYRATDFRMLEIGVFKGGSLEMWRNYFGPDATLFGIDIDPACANCVDSPNQVRIGSQDDSVFLNGVIAEMGRPDVILDDGSHIGRHQRTSFDVLFPVLAEGGLYMIEDTHTSYWPG